jgi:hypothetical protein
LGSYSCCLTPSRTLSNRPITGFDRVCTRTVFPTATEEDPACQGSGKPEPNDIVRTDRNDLKNQSFNNPVHIMPDWLQFAMLMRFTDGPEPDSNPSNSAIASVLEPSRRIIFDRRCPRDTICLLLSAVVSEALKKARGELGEEPG